MSLQFSRTEATIEDRIRPDRFRRSSDSAVAAGDVLLTDGQRRIHGSALLSVPLRRNPELTF